MLLFAGRDLARRIEHAEAANSRAMGGVCLDVAGGCAVFVGPDSPLTQAVAVGLEGPVREAEIDRLEDFFCSRGAPVSIELAPLADSGFVESLARRGYRLTEFNNVMVRRMHGFEAAAVPRVRPMNIDERDLWSYTVGHGFFEQPELTDEEMGIGRVIFTSPGIRCYLGTAEDGDAVGGAAFAARDGVALLFADSTVARFRRRGVQSELIRARLNDAIALGCDLAAASTLPGTGSQRNYERMGFQVAYTRVTLKR
jgi:hypothetical protein